MKKLIVALFAVLVSVTPAAAWGPQGHQVVAYIAQDLMRPDALEKARALLGPDGDLADVASWADHVRSERPQTAPWHYIDINIFSAAPGQDADVLNADGNTVVGQIRHDCDVLRDATADPTARREALKFLVHFVGDLHQPLHCADDHDRGGNDKHVTLLGHPMNLHQVWDDSIEPEPHRVDARLLATQLKGDVGRRNRRVWSAGDAREWALESWQIASTLIYPEYQRQLPDENLTATYQQQMQPIVYRQLEKAGTRLAWLLDGLFP